MLQSKIKLFSNWKQAILPVSASVKDAITNLNDTGAGIAIIVDGNGKLLGSITDGDIRRGLINGVDLEKSVEVVLHSNPLVVPHSVNSITAQQLMAVNKVQQLPIVDAKNKICGLFVLNSIVTPINRPNSLVIMAGGVGRRLRPETEFCPKPLLEVAGKPILQHIIEQAKMDGFSHFILAIHYLGHMIEQYFSNGSQLGVMIEYLREDIPLGTAGALSLLKSIPQTPLVVTNGDIMTDIKYGDLIDFHSLHAASGTMAVRPHEWQHPFGVVQLEGLDIVGFEEKPVTRSHINAGVYVLEPASVSELELSQHCDMPELFERLRKKGLRTIAYPMHEPWLDIGTKKELLDANSHGLLS